MVIVSVGVSKRGRCQEVDVLKSVPRCITGVKSCDNCLGGLVGGYVRDGDVCDETWGDVLLQDRKASRVAPVAVTADMALGQEKDRLRKRWALCEISIFSR